METEVIKIDPSEVKLLDVNARYMEHETFTRLTENIRDDGALTQIPFGWVLRDDETREPILDDDGNEIIEVLSGNHRVKAAVAAGLKQIDMQIIRDYLPPNQRKAIQLSHNAITGRDDPATLKVIYDSIDDPLLRIKTGLDDQTLALLDEVSISGLREANLEFQSISMTFMPDEIDALNEVWDTAKAAASGAKGMWLARWHDYDDAMDALETTSLAYGIKNIATALAIVLAVFSRHMHELQDGWLDSDGEPFPKRHGVPLATLIDAHTVPPEVGAKLKRVVDVMMSRGEIDKDERWRMLENLADAYIEGRITERNGD